MTRDYSITELMVATLARELRDGEVAMTGANSTVPVAACMLAQRLHAPNLTLILPSGVVNPRPGRLYKSASDGRWAIGAEAIGTFYDLFEVSENGRVDAMFYGGVQIDRHGNINLTQTGPRVEPPKFRGPGLANISFAVVCRRIFLYSAAHTPRTFVETVDYLTAPGHLDGPGARADAGIETDGPIFCITPLAAFGVSDDEALSVRSIHPGVQPNLLRKQTGFDLGLDDNWPVTLPPTDEELDQLRDVVDRTGVLREAAP